MCALDRARPEHQLSRGRLYDIQHLNFAAPMAGLGVVLRKRCCDSLPLPMCIANLLVSSQWFLYGNIVRDNYIMAPNGIGVVLAVLQLSDRLSTQTASTGISVVKGESALMRKFSEVLEKTARSGSFGVAASDLRYTRTRTASVPEIFVKTKRV
ncbi:mtN3/saliva family protein [Ostertagia ostertagi]